METGATSDGAGGLAQARTWPRRVRDGLRSLFRPVHTEEWLTRAYTAHLARRIPLIYCVVIIETAALSLAFSGVAPRVLTLHLPLAMCLVALSRALHWLPRRVAARPLEKISSDLARMNKLAFATTLVLVSWGMALYRYGSEAQQSLIQFIFATSAFTTILGVGQSRGAARSIGVAAVVPLSLFFLLGSHPNAVPVAVVQVVVTALLLVLTDGYHRDFVQLEKSRHELAAREREAAMLAESNRHNATFDPLTGALNRRAILARLEAALSGNTGREPWLALVDLDGFKHVNDTYGHAAGDTVLRAMGERIAAMSETVAHGRLGGDEFAILLDGTLARPEVGQALDELSEALRLPIVHQGVTLRLAASIGYSRTGGRTVSESLERSDAALYKAKDSGDGAVEFFTAEDEQELRRKGAVTRRFNDCPLEERLRLLYQPLVDIDTGMITGFEAFARWSPDGESWLGPAEFLPFAQATGRTGELTRLVMARALAECPVWELGLDLAINLSPRDVIREGTDEVLAALVREAGAPAERIVLEVTERALHGDPRRAAAQLAKLRSKGFRIALDDFGAGWSSLNHVRHLPLDRLKIDRGLAAALAEDPGARAIAGTIVGLAWQMGLECTLEGVETARQVETARALGLRIMQGYHFGRPGPAAEALAAIERAAA